MKIALVYPYFLEARVHADEIRVPPMGIYYVAAALIEEGHRVEVFNWSEVHRNPQRISEALTAMRPEVVAFSILHANRWGGLDIAAAAKRLFPEVTTVFGGIGASYLWEHLLTHFPQVDYVVVGEAEKSVCRLAACLEAGNREAIEQIAGIAYRSNGRAVQNPCDPLLPDLDSLPNPARYFTYQHLALTRGCPANCSFCGSPRFWQRRVRFHSPTYFADQLQRLYEKGTGFFFFSDDTFTLNRRKAIAVCQEILERNLPIAWQAISRVDTIDAEVLYWMRRAGCIQISYGVESGNRRIRNMLQKEFRDEQVETAFALTRRYGILPRAYFIYGCPGETRRTIDETIALIRRIRPLSAIFYILDLFPGTQLYEDFKQRSGATDDIWLRRVEDILYFETDPQLSREQVFEFGRRLRSSFYASLPEFIDSLELEDLPELAPLHADFLSRLAMTFEHGDYARIDAIPGKERLARSLYQLALAYHPDSRAYLGLGIGLQKQARYAEARAILAEGLSRFPEDEHLNICLGITYMNLGEYRKALETLLPFADSAGCYIADCYDALGDRERAGRYRR
jgi:radical SAM superfamily enzyme YgiQ (UPF0313 family)